jgi:hypothetical protein
MVAKDLLCPAMNVAGSVSKGLRVVALSEYGLCGEILGFARTLSVPRSCCRHCKQLRRLTFWFA